jgi:hypothetical protein
MQSNTGEVNRLFYSPLQEMRAHFILYVLCSKKSNWVILKKIGHLKENAIRAMTEITARQSVL